jgi:hypothetical protein
MLDVALPSKSSDFAKKIAFFAAKKVIKLNVKVAFIFSPTLYGPFRGKMKY